MKNTYWTVSLNEKCLILSRLCAFHIICIHTPFFTLRDYWVGIAIAHTLTHKHTHRWMSFPQRCCMLNIWLIVLSWMNLHQQDVLSLILLIGLNPIHYCDHKLTRTEKVTENFWLNVTLDGSDLTYCRKMITEDYFLFVGCVQYLSLPYNNLPWKPIIDSTVM